MYLFRQTVFLSTCFNPVKPKWLPKHLVVDIPSNNYFFSTLSFCCFFWFDVSQARRSKQLDPLPHASMYIACGFFCYLSEYRHHVPMYSTCTLLLIFDRCVYVLTLGRFWVHFIKRGFIQIIKSYTVLANKTKSACTVLNLFCDSDNITFPQLVESLSRLVFNTKFSWITLIVDSISWIWDIDGTFL